MRGLFFFALNDRLPYYNPVLSQFVHKLCFKIVELLKDYRYYYRLQFHF